MGSRHNPQPSLNTKEAAKTALAQRDIPQPPPDFSGVQPITGQFYIHNLPVGTRVVAMYLTEGDLQAIIALPKFLEALAEIKMTAGQKAEFDIVVDRKGADFSEMFKDANEELFKGNLQGCMAKLSDIVIGVFDLRNEVSQIKK